VRTRVHGALWLPFTQMERFDAAARTFVRGQGNRLVDARGSSVFDAVSSIWTIVHGHCHPAITEAIARQARELDHATLLGATNPRAEELAERLTRLLDMDYAFFASDGASAIEAALKMALQYWQQLGEPQRRRFVRLTDAYHGDTSGAMSLSDISVFKSRFGALTFETLTYEDHSWLERDDVAAVVVEPIVQAAAGMRIVPAERYAPLNGMKPLLVVDEIATGFGRTGTMFALEQLGIRADVVCVGKGLSGGSLPISATVVREPVFAAFRGAPGARAEFFHGHSYAGNPIACAAALASLDLFHTEQTLERARTLNRMLLPRLSELAGHPLVRDVRVAGLMCGIELASERISAGGAATPAWRVADELYARGHFTRPIGDVIQLVPPLSSEPEDLERFVADLHDVLG